MPTAKQLNRYGPNIGIVTMCAITPKHDVILDDRVQWWKHIPISDGKIKDMASIILARDTALSMHQHGYHTVVHCAAGRNRSGIVAALVLRELENLDGLEALEEVRRLRPGALSNPHFTEYLTQLGRPYQ
jgi:protein-tyrosine phosphatase